jgi:hypothetical protein
MAGGLYLPEVDKLHLYLDKFGNMTFMEFASEEEMFDYARKDGYGWDADKPAICFAFQWHEDDSSNSYELEMYFRDQFDARYRGIYSP